MSEATNPPGSEPSADPVAIISAQLEQERDPAPPSTNPDPAPSLVDDDPETDTDDEPSSPDDTDDDASDDVPDEPTDAERKYKVKVDGQELEVTEAELIKGFQLEANYRRKTAEIAEQRRAVEAEHQRISNERAYYAQQLQSFQESLQIPPEPDARLAHTDPLGYVQQKAVWEQQVRQHQWAQAEQQRLAQQTAVEQQQHYERHLSSEMERLQEALPDWKDPAKARAEKKSLTEYLRKSGYTDDEISAATDHRAIVLARKAALYDKIVASKPTIEQRVAQAPKTIKPGSTPAGETVASQRKAVWKQLERKGGVDAAAALIALG